jgi:hypothetical protein
MEDKQIADLVRSLEAHIENKDSDYVGASVMAAMTLLARGCYQSNAGEITITLSDCIFSDLSNDKTHYRITVKKLKRKPKDGKE